MSQIGRDAKSAFFPTQRQFHLSLLPVAITILDDAQCATRFETLPMLPIPTVPRIDPTNERATVG